MKPARHHKHNLLLNKVAPLLRFLIVSDMLIVGAASMLGPFYALYVEDFIIGSNEVVIGVSTAIYLVSRSILQIPIATLIDRIKGERDDYLFMVTFTILAGLFQIFYLYIDQVWQLYLMQVFLGIFTAITYPSYMALFTRHIDKHMEGTEWGIYYTSVDLSSAALASIGGIVAASYGFESLIITVTLLSLVGGLALIPIKKYIYLNNRNR